MRPIETKAAKRKGEAVSRDLPSAVAKHIARRASLVEELAVARQQADAAQEAITHALTNGGGDLSRLSDARDKAARLVGDLEAAVRRLEGKGA